ncbi:hypothetical protein COT94_01455 [Candidatus Falkowbacteria bacterium CG10_big_fil_rev_8_21_14_0_10_37_14]|uniref:Uncharacterized protein n=1 Tax=Candidatus Falkowbacteria bacterium CG10_big_fil_rev_8_21_14_0_10_37_14 TaxID=1974561 RepID=A0A2M6WTV7_9BACT|nr:hypothetical protein [Candidatus Falkowbacteria bacterium]PIT96228.1 MAG: hypothetical protein COT94_01455 [Candidatus Falkowbacteria bacterium CG10_big_fil_rev_8_21_14_0_10_37_14]
MGFLGDLGGTLGFNQMPSGENRDIKRVFNPYEEHTFLALQNQLKQLMPEARIKVVQALQTEGLWGKVTSSSRVIDAVTKNCGPGMARLVQQKVLTKGVLLRLTPEQIKRNIAYSRYMIKRNEEKGLNGNGIKPIEYQTAGGNQLDRKSGALDNGQKPETSMTKRPMSF